MFYIKKGIIYNPEKTLVQVDTNKKFRGEVYFGKNTIFLFSKKELTEKEYILLDKKYYQVASVKGLYTCYQYDIKECSRALGFILEIN